MSENKMLIDAAHPEETRVVVLRGGRVEEFDYESAARKQLRGNIYLAKVTRVEPALQAAFVDYGGNRHGFLAFNEIHPDYYQIPVADRLALLEEEAAEAVEDDEIELEAVDNTDDSDESDDSRDDEDADDLMDEPVDLSTIIEDDEEDDALSAAQDDAEEPESAADDEEAEDLDASAGIDSEEHDDVQDRDDDDEDDDDDDGRSTVLSQAMPRDEALTEEPGEHPTDEFENRSGGVAEPAPAAEEPEAKTGDTDQQPAAAEDSTDTSEQAAASSDDPQPDYDADDVEQPDAITEDAAGAAADNENVAEEAADEPEGSDATTARRGRRTTSRNSPGRRRRGGRSRRQRPRDAEVSADDDIDSVDQVGNEDALEELPSRPRRSRRSYKIQEVVKRRQVLLIQVVKEERGSKGAALTTYLSLAGRYTVLMPNTARGGGISRKITNPQDRKRLKAIAAELDVPDGMGLIIRTAGAARTKQEIKRDFEYLLRLWESVRELTLQSTAPALVYEEGDLIKRSIRDLYNKDVDQVLVAGQEAYRSAKSFMRMLMPSHAKNVVHYEEPEPLFTGHGIERQLNAMFSPYVHLPSGGYLVINQTEALVAVDVNSGRSTREFSIEETALNTNIEAAEEIARQLKLRDLAGLIVIDFIDMEERRNNRHVERRMRDALRSDRARIQVGRISPFGLLEMSRQRLRTGVLEGSTSPCPHCQGTGIIRSVESVALAVLRGLEDTVMAGCRTSLIANTTAEVALYILNNKREFVIDMEKRLGMPIAVQASAKMAGANFTIDKGEAPAAPPAKNGSSDAVSVDWGFEGGKTETSEGAIEGEEGRSRRRRRRRGGRRPDEHAAVEGVETDDIDVEAADEDKFSEDADAAGEDQESGEEKSGRRRRRGRRGGRRNRGRNRDGETVLADGDQPNVDFVEDFAETSTLSDNEERSDEGAGDHGNGQDAGYEDSPAALEAAPQSAASDLVTPIEIRPMNDQPEAVETADTDTQAAAPASPQVESNGNAPDDADPEAATSETGEDADQDAAQADAVRSRRARGEPVASEPRIERITVSPVGQAAGSENSQPAEGDDAVEQNTPTDQPTRRGWWQRKLLGEA
jgi:ribonuclease E